MAIKGYNFTTNPMTVVTPMARTLFMCLAEANEYTGKFGGKLVFTPEQLEQQVSVKENGGAKGKMPFAEAINKLLDSAYDEYTKETGKKATKVSKINVHNDADGNPTSDFELSCGNQEQPKILDRDKAVLRDYDTLVGNGSTLKAQLYLKPYVMQGKVGVTAYLNTVLLGDIIEYGGNDDDMFDDADTEDTLDF